MRVWLIYVPAFDNDTDRFKAVDSTLSQVELIVETPFR